MRVRRLHPRIDGDLDAREHRRRRLARQAMARRVPRGHRRGERQQQRLHLVLAIDAARDAGHAGDVVVVVDPVGRVHGRARVAEGIPRRGEPRRDVVVVGREPVRIRIARDAILEVRPVLVLVAQPRLDRQPIGQPPVVLHEQRQIACSRTAPWSRHSPARRPRAARARAPGCSTPAPAARLESPAAAGRCSVRRNAAAATASCDRRS